MPRPTTPEEKTICVNRRARFDYEIEEKFEAGIVLTGGEVKSLREGRAQLKDSYGRVERGEMTLINAHINPYGPAHFLDLEVVRTEERFDRLIELVLRINVPPNVDGSLLAVIQRDVPLNSAAANARAGVFQSWIKRRDTGR